MRHARNHRLGYRDILDFAHWAENRAVLWQVRLNEPYFEILRHAA